jgi:heme exporter protein CcmB
MTNPQSAIRNPQSSIAAFAVLLRREITVELRTQSLLTSMGLFAALCVVVVGLGVRGLTTDETFRRFVLAMLWVCTLFAAVVGLNRAAAADRKRGFFHALMLLPRDSALVYMVRLTAVFTFLTLTQALMAVLAVPLLKFQPEHPLLIPVVLMANLGVLAPGVLLASVTGRGRGGEALLAIALLPVVVPVFLGATGATDALLAGHGFAGALPYLLLLLVCDAMFLGLGLLLFGRLNEE